jgi:hypothetical protein
VRFYGTPMQGAKAALEGNGIPIISAGAYFPESSPGPTFDQHTAVGVLATTEQDAIRFVREALAGHGDFSGFEATRIAPAES